LRALYESRDPGDSPPLQLRLQIDDDRRIAEAARVEQRSRPRGTGRAFVIRIVSAVSVLALVLALIGLAHYKASPALDGSPAPFPRVPLQISGVSLIQAGINGGPVHVGGTQTSLVAAFPPDPVWEIAARGCQSDILAVIDSNGQPTWTGAHAGHTGSVVGDPSSQGAYVAGIGTDCLPTGYFSADGGLTWSAEALPAGLTSLPSWLAFDPSSADTLLLYSAGNIYNSPNAGLTWTHSKSGVIPLDFDSSGRLVGWTKGQFYQSLDDGASWQQTGAGPVDHPPAAGATSNGTLIGTDSGLWWYPLTAGPTLVHSGRVLSIATLGDGYVVLGVDPAGHPWLGTLDASRPAFSMAPLPPEASSLQVTGGEVSVNDSGAIVAFSGKSSLIALATLAH